MKPKNYEQAGVSIRRGDDFAARIAALGSHAVGELGGFAGGLEIDLSRYRHPVLLSSTDGVGTKLLVARALGNYDTVGIDLVAMCVNDLAVCGAQPNLFLDYIACGRIDDTVLTNVVKGIVTGCETAGCILAGGETAELPDMYSDGDIDLAGFAVGLVEREERLPRRDAIRPGDRVLGVASSGIHSNGFSLARKVLDMSDRDVLEELLTPTRIYVSALMRVRAEILAAAHITGGGLQANVERVLPAGLSLELTWDWPLPSVFERIQIAGDIPADEMRRVFNMGIGLALVVAPASVNAITALLDEPVFELGSVCSG